MLRTHSSFPLQAISEGMHPQAGCEGDQAALQGMNGDFSGPFQTAAPLPLGGRRARHHIAFGTHRWSPSLGLNKPGLDTAPPAGQYTSNIMPTSFSIRKHFTAYFHCFCFSDDWYVKFSVVKT